MADANYVAVVNVTIQIGIGLGKRSEVEYLEVNAHTVKEAMDFDYEVLEWEVEDVIDA